MKRQLCPAAVHIILLLFTVWQKLKVHSKFESIIIVLLKGNIELLSRTFRRNALNPEKPLGLAKYTWLWNMLFITGNKITMTLSVSLDFSNT